MASSQNAEVNGKTHTTHPAQLQDDSEAYFEHNPAPSSLTTSKQQAQTFVQTHLPTPQPVVLVTSGGTTVPLENQTVRFIDNFSAGTRGATSAEYFLEAGYAVIFLHREFSLLPYSRHYSHSRNCFLDYMVETPTGSSVAGGSSGKKVEVDERYQTQMLGVLRKYRRAKADGTLLLLGFTTINEYLWLLRAIALTMKPLGSRALYYLAAAVSDFFVPRDRMVEHKIQSGEDFASSNTQNGPPPAAHIECNRLVMDLEPVPKFLKRLVERWAPEGMIVSFKLETDPTLLTRKAATALKKYSHHLVIGNLLSTRKWEVVFVSKAEGEKWIRVPVRRRQGSVSGVEALVGRAEGERDGERDGSGAVSESENEMEADERAPMVEIESLIIPEVKMLHRRFMEEGAKHFEY